jgi:hypothetical protein
MSKDEFELAARRHADEEGSKIDAWDIGWLWNDYQKNPTNYDYLKEQTS